MLIQADARQIPLADGSVQCCVTSPPYWNLRDYKLGPNALGLEKTPELFIQHLVEIFREVKRVLRDDGICWIVIGDSYAGSGGDHTKHHKRTEPTLERNESNEGRRRILSTDRLKPKDLVGIPWMLAFALRNDGWYLRRDIIWAKGVSFCPTYSGSPMPESVQDRPSSSHEYVFLLSKSKCYFYDNEAVKERSVDPESHTGRRKRNAGQMDSVDPNNYKFHGSTQEDGTLRCGQTYPKRNLRSVWTINPAGYKGAHFATYPPALIEPMILASTSAKGCCPECGLPWERIVEREVAVSKECPKTQLAHEARGGASILTGTVGKSGSGRIEGYTKTLGWHPTCSCYDGIDPEQLDWNVQMGLLEYAPVPCIVLDPFCGSGTTGVVAIKHRREFVGLDLNSEYLHKLATKRLNGVQKVLL